MWLWLLLITPILIIRRNKFLRTYFQNSLYRIGIQIGTNIYTPVCDVQSDFCYFDIVFLKKHNATLHGYHIFQRKEFLISLKYIPIGHTLNYVIDSKVSEHLYFEGTPFHVHKGELILYQKKRKGLGFISVEINRSNKWPIE
jgi:hypothetical protein